MSEVVVQLVAHPNMQICLDPFMEIQLQRSLIASSSETSDNFITKHDMAFNNPICAVAQSDLRSGSYIERGTPSAWEGEKRGLISFLTIARVYHNRFNPNHLTSTREFVFK